MEHRDTYEQTHKKAKRNATIFTAIALSGAILFGTSKVGTYLKNKKEDNNKKPETTVVVPENSELVLTEDFDINNKEEVSKRAKEIYELSEKKYDVLDIENAIYIVNEKNDMITYPSNLKTDDEKFKYLQEISLLYGATFDDYLIDYVNVKEEIESKQEDINTDNLKKGMVPCSYMMMATSNEAKTLNINVAKVYIEQRHNIINKNKGAMIVSANDYYELYKKAKELEMSTGYKVVTFKEFSAINSLFTSLLSKEQSSELDEALSFVATSTNKLFSDASENLDLSTIIKESLDKGTFGKEITKLEEKYVESDKKSAEKIVNNNSNSKEETTIIDAGGKPVNSSTGKQEVISGNKIETEVETEEFIVSIPNSGIKEEVIEGGEVVSESKVQNNSSSTTTTNKVENYTSTTNKETTYVDADLDIPVMDDKEFFGEATDEDIEDYKKSPLEPFGLGLMSVGSLGTVFSKKKRR